LRDPSCPPRPRLRAALARGGPDPRRLLGLSAAAPERPPGMPVTTGEHGAPRWGFRQPLGVGAADIIQPDVGWCGGITELIKISALADAHGAMVVPHGSSVYSYHFVITRTNSPFSEFLMMHPTAKEVVPMFSPMLLGEPVPEDGKIRVPDTPGFGVEFNPAIPRRRPFTH